MGATSLCDVLAVLCTQLLHHYNAQAENAWVPGALLRDDLSTHLFYTSQQDRWRCLRLFWAEVCFRMYFYAFVADCIDTYTAIHIVHLHLPQAYRWRCLRSFWVLQPFYSPPWHFWPHDRLQSYRMHINTNCNIRIESYRLRIIPMRHVARYLNRYESLLSWCCKICHERHVTYSHCQRAYSKTFEHNSATS